jgi:hypothetical protein
MVLFYEKTITANLTRYIPTEYTSIKSVQHSSIVQITVIFAAVFLVPRTARRRTPYRMNDPDQFITFRETTRILRGSQTLLFSPIVKTCVSGATSNPVRLLRLKLNVTLWNYAGTFVSVYR